MKGDGSGGVGIASAGLWTQFADVYVSVEAQGPPDTRRFLFKSLEEGSGGAGSASRMASSTSGDGSSIRDFSGLAFL